MANPNGNPENLKPFTSEQSRDKAVKNGRKGGKASVKSRRRKKAMRELVNEMLGCKLTPEFEEMLKKQAPLALGKKKMTAEDAMIFGQMVKAMQGDTKAATFIRDTAGEKPADVVVQTDIEEAAFTLQAMLDEIAEDDG